MSRWVTLAQAIQILSKEFGEQAGEVLQQGIAGGTIKAQARAVRAYRLGIIPDARESTFVGYISEHGPGSDTLYLPPEILKHLPVGHCYVFSSQTSLDWLVHKQPDGRCIVYWPFQRKLGRDRSDMIIMPVDMGTSHCDAENNRIIIDHTDARIRQYASAVSVLSGDVSALIEKSKPKLVNRGGRPRLVTREAVAFAIAKLRESPDIERRALHELLDHHVNRNTISNVQRGSAKSFDRIISEARSEAFPSASSKMVKTKNS